MQIEDHVAIALDTAHQIYLSLRKVGVILLVLGLVCVTVANFV